MLVTIWLLCIIVREERRLDCSASVEILKSLTDKFYNPCMQVEGKELSPNSHLLEDKEFHAWIQTHG